MAGSMLDRFACRRCAGLFAGDLRGLRIFASNQRQEVKKILDELNIDWHKTKIIEIPNVMNYVASNVDTKSIIVVTGSISVAAEALNWYKLEMR